MLQCHRNSYVLDTCVLMRDPGIIFRFGRSRFIIPITVVRELEGLTKSKGRRKAKVSCRARQALKNLDSLGCNRTMPSIGITSEGTIVRVYSQFFVARDLKDTADNRIIGAALSYKRAAADDEQITLMTNDQGMINTSLECGLRTEKYQLRTDKCTNNQTMGNKVSLAA